MSVRAVKRGLRVEEVYDDSPAKEGGLKEGDIIVAANGKSLEGKTSDESTALIKGPAGTSVRLKLSNGRELSLKRAKVDIPIVQSELETADSKPIAWVRLAGFTSGSGDDVKAAVEKQLDAGAKGVVLDLRHNGGGLLDEAIFSASLFLPEGEVVVSTDSRSQGETVHETVDGQISKEPLVVLIDGGTASAAEILAAALADNRGAKVIGTRSFGKGLFQEERKLANGGALKLSVGEFFTPEGINLAESRGVHPDVRVRDDRRTKADEVRQRGLQVLAGQVGS